MKWQTRLTTKLPCNIPIIGAPMAGVAGGLLAAEVCRAGGLGFIGAGVVHSMEQLDEQIQIFINEQHKYHSTYPLCLGFLSFGLFQSNNNNNNGWDKFRMVLEKYQPQVIQFFAPAIVQKDGTTTNISFAKEIIKDIIVLAQVGNVTEAIRAVEAGADGLIVQGSEAGGHGLRKEYGNSLLPFVLDVTTKFPHVPVIAAGGIVDGRGVASLLLAGCDGVVLGTRLWATHEAMGHISRKDALVEAQSCDAVIRTPVFDTIMNTFNPIPWPEPYDSVGALRNDTTARWDNHLDELKQELAREDNTVIADFQTAMNTNDITKACVLSGEGVGIINTIEHAYDIVIKINQDAQSILHNRPKQLLVLDE